MDGLPKMRTQITPSSQPPQDVLSSDIAFELPTYKTLKDSKHRIVLHDGRELQYHRPQDPTDSLDLLRFIPKTYQDRPIEVEIGPGKGEFLARRAAHYPDRYFIGIDRRQDRVRLTENKLLRIGTPSDSQPNWAILREDARSFLASPLPPIQVLHIYQPDPWPKAKHHKHRLFRSPDAKRWAQAIVTGGELRVSTDHPFYFEEILAIVQSWKLFCDATIIRKTSRTGSAALTHFEGIFLGQNLPVYKAIFYR